MTGPLALVGSGEYTDAMIDTDRALLAALDARRPRVVVIPTASGLEPGMPEVWNARGARHFAELGAEVTPLPITERVHCFDPGHLADLQAADLFYFSGGNPNHVTDVWHGTPAWEALLARWHAGAAVAGCSAGAMMLGAFTIRVRDAMTGRAPQWVPAMGALPELAVLPHFDRMRGFVSGRIFDEILRTAPYGVTVVGVDEDTALVRIAGAWRVFGRQGVTAFGIDGGRHTYRAGEAIVI